MSKKAKIVIGVVIAVVAVVIFLAFIFNTAQFRRSIKTWESNVTGGLDRTVYVYDYSGDLINKYEGKIDIQYEDNRTLFDLDGKRVTINGGIVIVEEQ